MSSTIANLRARLNRVQNALFAGLNTLTNADERSRLTNAYVTVRTNIQMQIAAAQAGERTRDDNDIEDQFLTLPVSGPDMTRVFVPPGYRDTVWSEVYTTEGFQFPPCEGDVRLFNDTFQVVLSGNQPLPSVEDCVALVRSLLRFMLDARQSQDGDSDGLADYDADSESGDDEGDRRSFQDIEENAGENIEEDADQVMTDIDSDYDEDDSDRDSDITFIGNRDHVPIHEDDEDEEDEEYDSDSDSVPEDILNARPGQSYEMHASDGTAFYIRLVDYRTAPALENELRLPGVNSRISDLNYLLRNFHYSILPMPTEAPIPGIDDTYDQLTGRATGPETVMELYGSGAPSVEGDFRNTDTRTLIAQRQARHQAGLSTFDMDAEIASRVRLYPDQFGQLGDVFRQMGSPEEVESDYDNS